MMCSKKIRLGQRVLLAVALSFQMSPVAWAQLETVDPALYAAVEALIAADPEVANDPELAQLCRNVAEATVLDPRERAAVTQEVASLQREGVDLSTVIPTEVREAAREEFNRVQGQMREQLENLRATDPQAAREMELSIREGERCMLAFESGERYVPSAEMVAHAEGMFHEWESDMVARGAPAEYVERARFEFARWSGGEMEMMGPGGVMGGPGPGGELGHPGAGPGGMPSLDQMEQMVSSGQMTPEQLQMAKDYMANSQEFMASHPGYEVFGPNAQGDGGPPQGMTFEGYGSGPMEGFGGPGPMEGFGSGPMEYEFQSPMEAFAQWEAAEGQNVSPELLEQYREMAEQYQPPATVENQNYDNQQQQIVERYETAIHLADHNNDFTPEEHTHTIHVHSDGTRHDHTATSPADTAPGGVYIP